MSPKSSPDHFIGYVTHTQTHTCAHTHTAIAPGQVMKSTQGQVTKILSMTSAREGSSVLTDGHSIPEPQALPEHCQEVDWSSHGEADWHFLTPMCLISVATSRHVQHELHSLNAAHSNWHIGAVMAVAGGMNRAVMGVESYFCLI